jgi:hypothetical protein
MTIDRRLHAGALGLSLILAACGGSSASTAPGATTAPIPTSGPTSAGPTEAVPTDAPQGTEDPAATPGATGADPSFMPGAASDLEAMLPDEAGGVKYQKSSGKTINDVRVAIAAPVDSTSTDGGMVVAFQIKGVDAAKFISAMGADPATMTKVTIGGKQVLQTGSSGFTMIAYTKDDVLFEVLLASDKVTESIVSQLP